MQFQLIDRRLRVPVGSPGELKTSPDGHLFIRNPTLGIVRIDDNAISVQAGTSDQFTPLNQTDVLVVEKRFRVATLWRNGRRVRRVLETETIRELVLFNTAMTILFLVVLPLYVIFGWLPIRASPAAAGLEPLLDFTVGLFMLVVFLMAIGTSRKVGCLTGAAAKTPTTLYLGRRDGIVAADAQGAILANCKLHAAVQDILAVPGEHDNPHGVAVRTRRALYLLDGGLQVLWRQPLRFNAWCPQTFLSHQCRGSHGQPCLVLCDGHAIYWISLDGKELIRLQLPRHHPPTLPTFGVADFRGDGTDQVAVCLGRGPHNARPLLLYQEDKLIAQSGRLGYAYGVPQIGVADVNGDGHPEVLLFQTGWMKVFAVR